jgi:hypothetical protein
MTELWTEDKRYSRSMFLEKANIHFGNEEGLSRGARLHGEYKIDGIIMRFDNGLLHGGVDIDSKPQPAIVWADNHTEWRDKGKLHRDGGPAVISQSGGWEEFWKDGNLYLIRAKQEIVINPYYELMDQPLKAAVKQQKELFMEEKTMKKQNEEKEKQLREEYREYKEYGKITSCEKQLIDKIEGETRYKLARYYGNNGAGGSVFVFFDGDNKELALAPLGFGDKGFDIRLIKDGDWAGSKEIRFTKPFYSDEGAARIVAAANDFDNNKSKKLAEYLEKMEIGCIDDFKRYMKTLTRDFPGEFGKDSLKCANTIMEQVNDGIRRMIGISLKLHGCTDPEKTKNTFDKWAGIYPAPVTESSIQNNSMER